MHPLATETTAALPERIAEMLSEKGRNIFFPSKGILGQSAEAKGRKINATIGIALEDDGSPMRLSGLAAQIQVEPKDAFPYAPSYGKPDLRDTWEKMIRKKNPSLGDFPMSRPVVSQALTHALSICGYLFLDPGEEVILPDLFWGNYRLVFANGHNANIATYTTFANGGYHVAGLEQALKKNGVGKKVVLLNFPNNPTGYTCSHSEAVAIRDTLVASAEEGNDIVVLIDDAYFGLVYEDGVFVESMFSQLANAHPGVLAVKIDGATKEDYAWGLRVGFITYAFSGASAKALKALEDKTAGAVRGNISNASHVSQSLLLQTYATPEFPEWKREKYNILRERYTEVKRILEDHPEYANSFEPLPFNSGYFMCVQPKQADAETVRQVLLSDFDTGLIATAGLLRVAYSAAPKSVLAELFANLHAACQQVVEG